MSTRESAPGSTGGADVPGPLHGGPDDDYTPEQLATMTREELDLLGARYDSVQVLHVDPGPEPGSAVEKQAVRQVALTFALAGLTAFAAFVIYVGQIYQPLQGSTLDRLYVLSLAQVVSEISLIALFG